MRKYLVKILPYLLLSLIYVGVGEFFLIRFQEVTPLDTVVEKQGEEGEEEYFGRRLISNSLNHYKLKMFEKKQPKVLVAGQSITLQFRDFMFSPYENDFYNSGLMLRNLSDLEYLTSKFESGKYRSPDIMLLGMDYSFVLKVNPLDLMEGLKNPPEDQAYDSKAHFKAMQSIFKYGKTRKIPDVDVGYGRAGMIGRGYRTGGSYRYKPEVEKFVETGHHHDEGHLVERLANRQRPFIEPIEYDSAKAKRVFSVLKRIDELDIKLILYFPPYSDHFFKAAQKDDHFMSFWKDYMAFQDRVSSLGYNVIPFTTPKEIGLNDKFMIDSEHTGEVMCALQLYEFFQSNKESFPEINTKRIKQEIQTDYTTPISFLRDSISRPLRGQVNRDLMAPALTKIEEYAHD
ncbi:hypothetical protein [Salibacter halophilus]|uniref:Uncharacterized protein n=1 Tax=Salibacter halophilus TaxID=1803916 RepID=A0A6N6M3X0_9FLAO|nr:hypothetical protein [Salibacter halophilus]KAB1063980.1 hypothetical protein F3059_08055 [Salibacter halophilus]